MNGWEINPDRPVYVQLIEEIELRIVAGIYKSGDKIPSVRDLAQEAAVNPNTMQKALAELERSGLISSQRTSGKFVTEDTDMIVQVKESLARNNIEDFLAKMQKLGFTAEQTAEKIRAFK